MRIRLLLYVLAGVIAVGAVVAWMFYIQRGAHMELKGTILKVRTLAIDEHSSVAVVDFRLTNVADYVWMVRSIGVSIQDGQGYHAAGSTISDTDAQRLFEYYPLLGQKFNNSLTPRTRIQPHQTVDRMIGVRFEVPEPQLQARRSLTIQVDEVDGGSSEITEGAAGGQ